MMFDGLWGMTRSQENPYLQRSSDSIEYTILFQARCLCILLNKYHSFKIIHEHHEHALTINSIDLLIDLNLPIMEDLALSSLPQYLQRKSRRNRTPQQCNRSREMIVTLAMAASTSRQTYHLTH